MTQEHQQILRKQLPIFAIMFYIRSSQTVQCLLMDKKFQTQTDIMLIEDLLKQNFHITRRQKTTGWRVRATPTKKKQERCQLEK